MMNELLSESEFTGLKDYQDYLPGTGITGFNKMNRIIYSILFSPLNSANSENLGSRQLLLIFQRGYRVSSGRFQGLQANGEQGNENYQHCRQ